MKNVNKTYHNLLNKIQTTGKRRVDPNRVKQGVHRLQITSHTIEHDMSVFPAINTKKLYWKGIVGELIWFLRGDTNIKYLVDNNINFWNKDAYNVYLRRCKDKGVLRRATIEQFINAIKNNIQWSSLDEPENIQDKFYTLGDLGKIYGGQWRGFSGLSIEGDSDRITVKNKTNLSEEVYANELDQIKLLIQQLKDKPLASDHIVTAWNPSEKKSQGLPPCHWSFEVLTEELSRLKYCKDNNIDLPEFDAGLENSIDCMDSYNIPKYSFDLKWHQRSVDTFLGLPFNITSYAVLSEIIAKLVNMVPSKLIGDLSNVHIYEPHNDCVTEQLNRDTEKYKPAKFKFSEKALYLFEMFNKNKMDNRDYNNLDKVFDSLEISDFILEDYNSYPTIKTEMLAYDN